MTRTLTALLFLVAAPAHAGVCETVDRLVADTSEETVRARLTEAGNAQALACLDEQARADRAEHWDDPQPGAPDPLTRAQRRARTFHRAGNATVVIGALGALIAGGAHFSVEGENARRAREDFGECLFGNCERQERLPPVTWAGPVAAVSGGVALAGLGLHGAGWAMPEDSARARTATFTISGAF